MHILGSDAKNEDMQRPLGGAKKCSAHSQLKNDVR